MIYVDIDGVLADTWNSCIDKEVYDASPQKFWEYESTRYDGWFLNPPLIKGALEAMRLLNRLDMVAVLGALPKPTGLLSAVGPDKTYWLNRHRIPRSATYLIPGAKNKVLYCHSVDDIIIDDSVANVEAWRAAGGTAILFTSWDEVITKIKELYNVQA